MVTNGKKKDNKILKFVCECGKSYKQKRLIRHKKCQFNQEEILLKLKKQKKVAKDAIGNKSI